MTSNFKAKIEESAVSVIPVMLIVVILHFTIAPLGEGQLAQYLMGGFLLIVGLAIFLVGADIGMVPFGQKVGSSLTYLRRLGPMLAASFAIGFAVTIAEPDVQVLADQVVSVIPAISKSRLLMAIAVGVGLFVLVGIVRMVFQLSLRLVLFICYGAIFIACAFVKDPSFISIAFDSGGATTGPVTVPFIMAMGLGVAATAKKKEGDDNGFGLVGLASIGPIAAVVMMGLAGGGELSTDTADTAAPTSAALSLISHFLNELPHVSYEIGMALLPIVIIFFFFQVVLLKLPHQQLKRILLGFIYTFIGLTMFMVGVKGGFSPIGQSLGLSLGAFGAAALIPVGLILGAVVVCAEPAVWVLTEQVENLSGGHIRRPIMLVALSISIALAVAMGMTRVVTGLSIWYFLAPGYALALLLTRLCPPLFTAIAFDSGGVASGPMSTTFVLSLTLGASIACGGNPATDAFGMVAMIAMAPLVTIQILGLIFKYKEDSSRHKKEN
ncbi:DUF1538 domain-containing protein [Deltaproteobacteria bacterium OttesenSCG-928-K17]|nr:DUF1538 domain-containing protein [Deltaproteobacteria bacterium OttesenSCG-928-K17]